MLKKTARVNRLSALQTALRITLPFCAPYLLTAAKLALAYAFIGVIGSEFIMARAGMGYEISYAYTNFDNATMYPLILLILLLSIAVEQPALALGARAARQERTEVMQSGKGVHVRNTAILIGGLFLFWELAYLVVGEVALRSPWETIQFLGQLMRTDIFWLHLADSAKAFGVALTIAVVLGLLIGFALGLHRLSGDAMEPMLVALYSIPKITLYPIILLAFGLGISAKIAFGAIHGIIPVALFTLSAVRNIRPILIKTGRVLKLSPPVMVRSILFPAAVPEIFTGIRVGFSLTLIGTVLGEMFAAQHGLGYLLMNGISLYNVDLIMAVTFLLVVFAASVNTVLLAIDRRLHHG